MPPETAEQLANKLDLSVRLVRDILYEMLETSIISETVTSSVKENAYQPGQDIEKLTVGYVFDLLDKRGRNSIKAEDTKDLETMMKVVDNLSNEILKSKSNKLVYEIG